MIRRAAYAAALLLCTAGGAAGNDWPYWRGPEQNGMTREKAVVTSWSRDGENVLWKVPLGGRSTPIVMDGRVYAIAPAGSGECLQERVICLDADTGKTIWEHRFNVYHTDIVEARLGWTSVVGDPETGNVYAHGTGGEFFCFDRDGKILWKHSLAENFGRTSGYGGRLHTPIIDEDRVIFNMVYILTRWGTGAQKAGHRYFAFDKRTGEVLWAAQPGGRPLDTTYSTPAVTVVDGKRLLIAANADGNVYGMLARDGEKRWTFRLSKRGINSSIVTDGKYAYVTHSEENITGTQMGSVVCLDASKSGDITDTGVVWRHDGLTVGYASPAVAHGRLYVVTNAATMLCFDAQSGKKYWEHTLGRVMKGSPVVTADGVIYVGEVNGRFLTLRDAGDHCEELDVVEFPHRGNAAVEINGSPAVANGRVYFMNTFEMYCLGREDTPKVDVPIPSMAAEVPPDPSNPAMLHVVPAELSLRRPARPVSFRTQLFDANGRALETATGQWMLRGLDGTIGSDGRFAPASEGTYEAGFVHAKVGDLDASARIRIAPALPVNEPFDKILPAEQPPGWIGIDGTTKLIERDGTVVLKKEALRPSAMYARMRAFSGPPLPTGYTVEADLLASPRPDGRPVLSDMGLINARYTLILLGYEKQLRLVTYAPIPRLQVDVPFDWKPDVWYRAKFSVNLLDGMATVRGKVWPRGQEEPVDWTAEMIDPCPNTEGSPGLYAYSKGTTVSRPGSPVFFDNYKVYRNED